MVPGVFCLYLWFYFGWVFWVLGSCIRLVVWVLGGLCVMICMLLCCVLCCSFWLVCSLVMFVCCMVFAGWFIWLVSVVGFGFAFSSLVFVVFTFVGLVGWCCIIWFVGWWVWVVFIVRFAGLLAGVGVIVIYLVLDCL